MKRLKTTILLIGITFLFFQCGSTEKEVRDTRSEGMSKLEALSKLRKQNPSVSQKEFEKNYEDSLAILFQIDTVSGYLPVYKFSDSIVGIAYYGHDPNMPLGIQQGFEYLFSEENQLNFEPSSTINQATIHSELANDILYKNDQLSSIVDTVFTKTYTVICTRGTVQRRFTNSYFSFNECYSNQIYLTFEPIDTAIYGEPLWAVVSNTFEVQPISKDKLNSFCEIVVDFQYRNYDYFDEPQRAKQFTVLGEHEGKYLIYKDDFSWRSVAENTMLFPGRLVIQEINDTFRVVNTHSLDLFGVPCL